MEMKTNTGIGESVYRKTSAAAASADGGYAGGSADSGRKPFIASYLQSQESLADGYACSAMEERFGIREEGMF
jgi:hypothetical protein